MRGAAWRSPCLCVFFTLMHVASAVTESDLDAATLRAKEHAMYSPGGGGPPVPNGAIRVVSKGYGDATAQFFVRGR